MKFHCSVDKSEHNETKKQDPDSPIILRNAVGKFLNHGNPRLAKLSEIVEAAAIVADIHQSIICTGISQSLSLSIFETH